MPTLNGREIYFSGQEVIVEDLQFDQVARVDQDRYRVNDFWSNGILKDANGLSNMQVTINSGNSTLIDVDHGTAYCNGYRIDINQDAGFDANNVNFTTNGICTPRSSGNIGVPLADYTLNQPNHVWAEYVHAIGTGRTAVSAVDGGVHYPEEYDGYRIAVSTNNYPGYHIGLTNAVYLATVIAQGIGNPLLSTAVGLTDIQKLWTSINPQRTINGSTNNLGLEMDIAHGTISTPDLRNDAVTNDKLGPNSITARNITPSAVTTDGISNLAVTTDKINSLAVTTDKIAAQAVTFSTNTSANGSEFTGGTSVVSASITTTGGAVLIMAGCNSQTSTSVAGIHVSSWNINRGGSTQLPGTIRTIEFNGLTGGEVCDVPVHITALDTPAAGTYTYYLRYELSTGTCAAGDDANIVLIELKK